METKNELKEILLFLKGMKKSIEESEKTTHCEYYRLACSSQIILVNSVSDLVKNIMAREIK